MESVESSSFYDSNSLFHRRFRHRDFTPEETQMILTNFVDYHDVIYGKLNLAPTDINATKREIFETILQRVNAVGGNNRTITAIKEKWQNARAQVRRKAMHFFAQREEKLRSAGGGLKEETVDADEQIKGIFDDIEYKIFKLLPPDCYLSKYLSSLFIFLVHTYRFV